MFIFISILSDREQSDPTKAPLVFEARDPKIRASANMTEYCVHVCSPYSVVKHEYR